MFDIEDLRVLLPVIEDEIFYNYETLRRVDKNKNPNEVEILKNKRKSLLRLRRKIKSILK